MSKILFQKIKLPNKIYLFLWQKPLRIKSNHPRNIYNFLQQELKYRFNTIQSIMQNTKQKKSSLSLTYEEAFKEHMKTHQEKTQKAGIPIIEQQQLDRRDRTQEFYKTFERQFRNSIILKLGFKIAALQIEEQDLALYCFSLLQAQANFPIKIFTIDHNDIDVFLDSEETSRKDLWMETHIMVASLLTNSREEHLFQNKIYTFFNEFLLNLVRDFIKQKINWDYMVTKEYTDEKVIYEFQKVVIGPANEEFIKTFDGK